MESINAPKVRSVLSSKPISAQAARTFLSRFLETEREDDVVGEEVFTRLEAVCRSLPSSEKSEKEEKKAKKSAKKEAKKEKKRKRSSEPKDRKKAKTS